MKRYLSTIILRVAMLLVALAAVTPSWGRLQNEVLTYVIAYKWGFIEKDAAEAVLTLFDEGDHYQVQLSGETMSWINDFLCVRDTLQGRLEPDHCLPQEYIKLTHQGSEYQHDVVKYQRQGDKTTGYATRIKQNGDGPVQESDTTLYATGPTYDLLSIFYYLRTLDFKTMEPGHKLYVNLFSGWTAEQLCITYEGEEDTRIGSQSWPTYALRFDFEMDGKPYGHTMYIWYSQDERHIPVKLKGVLSFGSVQAYYTGG